MSKIRLNRKKKGPDSRVPQVGPFQADPERVVRRWASLKRMLGKNYCAAPGSFSQANSRLSASASQTKRGSCIRRQLGRAMRWGQVAAPFASTQAMRVLVTEPESAVIRPLPLPDGVGAGGELLGAGVCGAGAGCLADEAAFASSRSHSEMSSR